MNKTDRLLAVVLELQRKGTLRAEDLAATFETSVRTIYRDMQALCEAGVPVVSAPGVGYFLMEGYFLPPVSFTVEEAVTLLIGTEFVEQKFDTTYRANAQTARAKIEVILPERIRANAARERTTVRLVAVEEATSGAREKDSLQVLRQAILEARKVRFGYSKPVPDAEGNRQSTRVVAPYGLVLVQGSWTLIAQCDTRRALRHFRLSRMNDLTLLDDRFVLPPTFSLNDYQPVDDRDVHVRVQVAPHIAPKVKESRSFYLEAFEDHADGLHVIFRVHQPEDVLPWVLGWGADVVVLEPTSLRQRVLEEARRVLERY
jgi:predicted DNA-binding transcriptional regulator YafY